MLNKINLYILKKFFYSFILTFLIFAVILFIGDFVEQFRKSTGKNVSLNIIFQLTLLNFLSLLIFYSSINSILKFNFNLFGLIKGSENNYKFNRHSNIKITLPAITLYIFLEFFLLQSLIP